MMMKVAVVTDGRYGERSYKTIKKYFDCKIVKMKCPSEAFLDDVEIPNNVFKKLKDTEIILIYILHPDVIYELVRRISDGKKWIIVASWDGEGFKKQLQAFKNVICPDLMCNIRKIGDKTFDKFASKIGKPKVEIKIKNGKLKDIKVLRTSPCGATLFVANYIKKKYINKKITKDLPREAGFKVQHYPCMAPKINILVDNECKKQFASELHKEAFEKALKNF